MAGNVAKARCRDEKLVAIVTLYFIDTMHTTGSTYILVNSVTRVENK